MRRNMDSWERERRWERKKERERKVKTRAFLKRQMAKEMKKRKLFIGQTKKQSEGGQGRKVN